MIDIKTRQSHVNANLKTRSIDADGDVKMIIEGYFIRYNEETNLYDNIFEEVAPESVLDSLANTDIRALFNHNTEIVLGRTGNKTLELRSDEQGLYGSIEINPYDKQAVDIYNRVLRGDITSCSFGFHVVDQSLEERSDGSFKFTIKKMNLLEVSPVTFPAYSTTSISARGADVNQFKESKLLLKKEALLKRLKGESK